MGFGAQALVTKTRKKRGKGSMLAESFRNDSGRGGGGGGLKAD